MAAREDVSRAPPWTNQAPPCIRAKTDSSVRYDARVTGASPEPTQPEGLDRATLIVAGVVLLGAVMSILDTTVVNVAIDRLATVLNLDDGERATLRAARSPAGQAQPASEATAPTSLPTQSTSFVGRQRELATATARGQLPTEVTGKSGSAGTVSSAHSRKTAPSGPRL